MSPHPKGRLEPQTWAIEVGRIWGIPIVLRPSWFLVLGLLTGQLALGLLPSAHPGWAPPTYWVLGIATALLFFACVLVHELGHSHVALRHGLPVHGITLFVFGGVSRLGREPVSPELELRMAIAGPLTSLVVAGLFALVSVLAREVSPIAVPCALIARVNLMLALFNLLPGYPLDGGRVLRALVWRVTGSLRNATAIAALGGHAVALGLFAAGAIVVLRGNAGGLWLALIGWFLYATASAEAARSTLARLLAHVTVGQAMRGDCARVPASLPLDRLVQDHLLGSGERCVLVVDDGRLGGLVTLGEVRAVPRARWSEATTAEVMRPAATLVTAAPDEPLLVALERLDDANVAQLPVVSDGRLVGLLGRADVLRHVRANAERQG